MPNPFGPLFGDDWFVDESARIVVTEAGVFPLPTTEGPTLLGGIAEAAAEADGTALTTSVVFVAGTAEAAAEADGTALTTSVAFVGWGIPVGI